MKLRTFLRIAAAAFFSAYLVLVSAPAKPASAHPMGNFTINRYTSLTVVPGKIDLLYIVDMAEIPAFQELTKMGADRSANLTPSQRDGFISKTSSEVMRNIALQVDGTPQNLKLDRTALTFPPGAGGIPTLRLEMNLSAALKGSNRGTIEFRDENFSDRIGWKEIIAVPAGGVTFESSSVPEKDISDALHRYPTDATTNPPKVSAASIVFRSSGSPASADKSSAATNLPQSDGWGSLGWVRQQTDAISSIMQQKDMPLSALLFALFLAFTVGSAHALSPGHGKTVVAAYLVGSRGTAAHAAFLGLTVTLSHTIGVFILGFVVLYLANFILPETLYPWLSFFSGALLVIMGLSLFVQRWRAWRRSRQALPATLEVHDHSHSDEHGHDHPHDHAHDHSHDHSHDHGDVHTHDHDDHHTHAVNEAAVPHKHGPLGRAHTHLPAQGQPVTLWNLLVLGITGGIIPCPSALVVLLVAVASGQIALGMLLILAFSLGLATVLTAIGVLMVYSRNLLNRFSAGGTRVRGLLTGLPMFSAVAVSILGVFIAAGAFNVR